MGRAASARKRGVCPDRNMIRRTIIKRRIAMKRSLACLLALVLICAALPAFGQEAADRSPAGEWYADMNGFIFTLSLREDGTYTLSSGDAAVEGTWELAEGNVILDGEAETALQFGGEALTGEEEDISFSREMPETYQPAPVNAEAQVGDFDGYWSSVYVGVGGMVLPSASIGDDSEANIQGVSVALGGWMFLGAQFDFEYENAALILRRDALTITLELQQDGLLRMTVDTGLTVYLAPGEPADAEPEAAE